MLNPPYFRCAVKNLKQMYASTGMKRSCVGKRKKFFMIIATKIIAKKCTCMRRDITEAEEGIAQNSVIDSKIIGNNSNYFSGRHP